MSEQGDNGFFSELKRRNVFRVAIAFIVVAWLLLQVVDILVPMLDLPNWVGRLVLLLIAVGFPIALLLAWAFELTPEGIKREKDIDRTQSVTRATGRKLDRVIIAVLVIAVSYFLWERQAGDDPVDAGIEPGPAEPVAEVNAEPDAGAKERSIAVLPFINMSSDEEQEWFSDGLTEEILNALARTPDLLVAARTSSFKYKGSNEDIPTIAAALGVAHVLEGSVRSTRDRLRVTAQLIRASDGFHLWSQTYDREPEDVIQIQEDIAVEIATALETAMDPEALARMVSSGTSSVPAYNAYLEGLAIDSSSLSTGDTYSFLRARDAFKRAIELDPEFSFAYWELAQFWEIQLRTTNIVAGIVELPREEMLAEFEDAIDKAIRFERDPVNQSRVRVLQAIQELDIAEALRLNTEYLKQRPNDQTSQNLQLQLLADLGMVDELRAAIENFENRDGYDLLVNNDSITASMLTNDKEFVRRFAQGALRRMPDRAFLHYQSHRAFLFAGDIDGAAALIPAIEASDLPASTKQLALLRQTCAEGRVDEAWRVFEKFNANFGDDLSLAWISHKMMGLDDEAHAMLAPLDETRDLDRLSDFVSYHYFEPRRYPNLVELLKAQGVEPREPLVMPYRCKT
jgi:TolB-like protein/tetratricopeptide (TPR) repeat protein